ncbi:hypothetical protein BGZ98_010083 [Dissophora globulifera]|nr:hypothetical protein BGZ98_010083 [Dissophora globulifera]
MSGYYTNTTGTGNRFKTDPRAPNPAHNRQIPQHLRVSGSGGGSGIFCYGCNQTKPRLAFSETQLKKAANKNPDKKHQIMHPIPTNYAKTQRKRQEKATCMECRRYIEDDDSEEDFDIEDDPDYYHGDITDIL